MDNYFCVWIFHCLLSKESEMCKNQQSLLLVYLFKCLLSFFGDENVIGEGLTKETAIAVKGGQNISILR